MKIGIVQPYFFPYIGYFQLINAVDVFVFYDDVNFIKNGWINRNKIPIDKDQIDFTVPLYKKSPNKVINEIEVHPEMYSFWRKKFLATIHQNYGKTEFFGIIYPLIEDVLFSNSPSIGNLSKSSKNLLGMMGGSKNYLKLS